MVSPLFKPLRSLRRPQRRRFRACHVPDEFHPLVELVRSGGDRRRHIDPRRELTRERRDELDFLIRKNFADRLNRHIAFAARKRLATLALRAHWTIDARELGTLDDV